MNLPGDIVTGEESSAHDLPQVIPALAQGKLLFKSDLRYIWRQDLSYLLRWRSKDVYVLRCKIKRYWRYILHVPRMILPSSQRFHKSSA